MVLSVLCAVLLLIDESSVCFFARVRTGGRTRQLSLFDIRCLSFTLTYNDINKGEEKANKD